MSVQCSHCCDKIPNGKQLKGQSSVAHGVRKAWRQEPEEADHAVPTVRKQREMNTGRSTHFLLMQSRTSTWSSLHSGCVVPT